MNMDYNNILSPHYANFFMDKAGTI